MCTSASLHTPSSDLGSPLSSQHYSLSLSLDTQPPAWSGPRHQMRAIMGFFKKKSSQENLGGDNKTWSLSHLFFCKCMVSIFLADFRWITVSCEKFDAKYSQIFFTHSFLRMRGGPGCLRVADDRRVPVHDPALPPRVSHFCRQSCSGCTAVVILILPKFGKFNLNVFWFYAL